MVMSVFREQEMEPISVHKNCLYYTAWLQYRILEMLCSFSKVCESSMGGTNALSFAIRASGGFERYVYYSVYSTVCNQVRKQGVTVKIVHMMLSLFKTYSSYNYFKFDYGFIKRIQV